MDNLPTVANDAVNKIESIQFIKVCDEKTNQAAIEQIKYAKLLTQEFEEAIDWKRKELYEPYKKFLDAKKIVVDKVSEFMKRQKQEVARFELQRMKEIDADISKTKTSFASSKTTIKVKAQVIDTPMFIATLMESGKTEWVNAIFDEPNSAMVKAFVEFMKFDSKSKYPGLKITSEANVKVR